MPPSSTISRRQFLRITASAGLLLAGGLGYGIAGTQAAPVRVEETRFLLGSIAHLTLISHTPEHARQVLRAALARMAELEDVFSRFRPHSQLTRLNVDGHITGAHPALQAVLAQAQAYGQITAGAFDVTIEPVLRLYREGAQTGQMPEASAVAAARQLVDYRQITLAGDRVQLEKPGMAVTLDGIAKGYIIDAGIEVLRAYGFDNIMVELGGDLHTRGNAGMRPWQVQVQSPREDDVSRQSLVVQLHNTALATSGDYLYTFTPDRRLHHIIDPASGVSPDELASASVIAPTASAADALSTAVLVLGARAGLGLIESLPDTEALMITKQGAIYQTAQFPLR